MAEAMIAEDYFTADAALRYKYEQREKFLRDQRSRENYAREEEKNRGILKLISSLREFDIPEVAIMQKIMEKYDLDLKEAEKYMAMATSASANE